VGKDYEPPRTYKINITKGKKKKITKKQIEKQTICTFGSFKISGLPHFVLACVETYEYIKIANTK
jgi:hypothetical protein